MAKKTFKTATQEQQANPALSYISEGKPEQEQELKSKRLNLLIRPSVYADIEKIAAMKRVSTNDLINTILDEYREREAAAVEKYNATFGEGE